MRASGKNQIVQPRTFSADKNLLELIFQDISTFDAQNPVVGLLLRKLDIGKKDVASAPIKKGQIPLISIYKVD